MGDELVVLVDGIRRADGAGRKIVEVVAGYSVTLGNMVRVVTCVFRSSAGSPRWQVPRENLLPVDPVVGEADRLWGWLSAWWCELAEGAMRPSGV